MFGFWEDKKNDKKNPYVRPVKKEDISGRRTKVHVTDKGKDIGKTTVVKKISDKSGFWTEDDRSNTKSKSIPIKENFKTKEDTDENNDENESGEVLELRQYIDNLSSTVDKLHDELDNMNKKIETLGEELKIHKEYTKEVLTIITSGLKAKLNETKIPISSSIPSVISSVIYESNIPVVSKNDSSSSSPESITSSTPLTPSSTSSVVSSIDSVTNIEKRKFFKLDKWNDRIYMFGKQSLNVVFTDDISFAFIYNGKNCFAYGHYEKDEDGNICVKLDEFTKENGLELLNDEISFPILLEYIDNIKNQDSYSHESDEGSESIIEEVKSEPVFEKVEEVKQETVVEKVEEVKQEAVVEKVEEVKQEAVVEKVEEMKQEAVVEKVEEVKSEVVVEKVEKVKQEAVVEKVEEVKSEPVFEKVEEVKSESDRSENYSGTSDESEKSEKSQTSEESEDEVYQSEEADKLEEIQSKSIQTVIELPKSKLPNLMPLFKLPPLK